MGGGDVCGGTAARVVSRREELRSEVSERLGVWLRGVRKARAGVEGRRVRLGGQCGGGKYLPRRLVV